MNLAEIKEEILNLGTDDRQELAILLRELSRKDNPEYLRELEAEMQRMDRGEKFGSTEVRELHQRLSAEGA